MESVTDAGVDHHIAAGPDRNMRCHAVGAEYRIPRGILGPKIPVAEDPDVTADDIGALGIVKLDTGDALEVGNSGRIGHREEAGHLDEAHQGAGRSRRGIAICVAVEGFVTGIGYGRSEEIIGEIVAQIIGGAVIVGQRGAVPGD